MAHRHKKTSIEHMRDIADCEVKGTFKGQDMSTFGISHDKVTHEDLVRMFQENQDSLLIHHTPIFISFDKPDNFKEMLDKFLGAMTEAYGTSINVGIDITQEHNGAYLHLERLMN